VGRLPTAGSFRRPLRCSVRSVCSVRLLRALCVKSFLFLFPFQFHFVPTALGAAPLGKPSYILDRVFVVEEFFYADDVFRDIHIMASFDFGSGFPAFFEPSELLECSILSSSPGAALGIEQGIALENVESEVLPIFHVDFCWCRGSRGSARVKNTGRCLRSREPSSQHWDP